MWPRYLFLNLETCSWIVNSVICSTQREVVVSQETRKEQLSFHNFLVELTTKSVNFLCRCAAYISYALRGPCIYQVYWNHFLLHMLYWNHFHTQHIARNLHLSRISEWIWICYTTNGWILHNVSYSMTTLNYQPSFFFGMSWFFHGTGFTE